MYLQQTDGEDLNDELLNSLIQREDIIITLHIAFYTEAAVENLIVDALDAAMDVINTGRYSSESELVKMSFYKNNTNYDSTTYKGWNNNANHYTWF